MTRLALLARRWGGPEGGRDGMAIATAYLARTLADLGVHVEAHHSPGCAPPWQHPGVEWVADESLPDSGTWRRCDLIITTMAPSWRTLAAVAQRLKAQHRLIYWHHHGPIPSGHGCVLARVAATGEPAQGWEREIVLPPSTWALDSPPSGTTRGPQIVVPGAGRQKGGPLAAAVAALVPDLPWLVLPGRASEADLAPWRALRHVEVARPGLAPERWLERALAVVSPTRSETYGLCLAEAAARGIPVICSPLPGPRWALGRVAHYLSMDASAEDWAAALRGALAAPTRRLELPPYRAVVADALGLAPTVAGSPPAPAPQPAADCAPQPAPRRPHVVLVAQRLLPARMGGEMSAIQWLRRLAKEGTATCSAVYSQDAPPPRGIPEVSFMFRPGASPEDLAAEAERLRPDVIVAHDRWTWPAVAALTTSAARLAEVRYWTGVLADPREADTRREAVLGIGKLLRGFDGLLANSPYTAGVLSSVGVPGERVAVARPPVEPRALTGAGGGDYDPEGPVLVVGERKMRADVLAALRQAGPVEVIPYDLAESKPLAPEEMAAAYRRCAVVAHPTYLSEAYCRAALEGMAHGRPLVYPDRGNLPWLIGRSAGICLPDAATPQQWADACARARREARRRGVAGRQRAAWIAEYDDAHEAIRDAVLAAVARRSPGSRPVVAVPPYPGVWTAAQHLARVLGARCVEQPPQTWDVLLLGSYSATWLAQLPSWRQRGRRTAMWWHSDLAQSDFSAEPIRLKEAIEAVKKGHLAALLPTAESLCRVLEARGIAHHWLPDLVDFAGALTPRKQYRPAAAPSVSLFAGASARKNHATSLGAAALAGADVHAFPRLLREGRLAALVSALGVRVVTHEIPMADKHAVIDLVGQQTCTLHPSHGETFCYAAAESILAGTPAIGSGCVPVLQGVQGDEGLSVLPDPSDCGELARRILLLHRDPALRGKVVAAQRLALEELCFRNELVARRSLRRLCR